MLEERRPRCCWISYIDVEATKSNNTRSYEEENSELGARILSGYRRDAPTKDDLQMV